MAIIVVGGHSRDVGKTSVVAGLISGIPELDWTAIKITQFGHGVCSVTSEPCDCALNEKEHAWSIEEEIDRSGGSDTSRFLVAGARRVLWARTKQGMLAEAMPALREEMNGAQMVIIESNSIMRFVRPALYLTVLDPANKDFKDSAREFLDRADAVLLHRSGVRWNKVSLKPVAERPVFAVEPPEYVSAGLVSFVRERLCDAKERAAKP